MGKKNNKGQEQRRGTERKMTQERRGSERQIKEKLEKRSAKAARNWMNNVWLSSSSVSPSVLFICCSSVISSGRHKSLHRPTIMGFTHSATPLCFYHSVLLHLPVISTLPLTLHLWVVTKKATAVSFAWMVINTNSNWQNSVWRTQKSSSLAKREYWKWISVVLYLPN